MTTWLRTNRVALGVIAACLPPLVVLLLVLPIGDRAGRQGDTRTVDASSAGVIGGMRYRVLAAGEFGRAEGVRLPVGVSLLAAAVQVTPTSETAASNCAFTLNAPSPEGLRTWQTEGDVARYGYPRGSDYSPSCRGGVDSAYGAETLFLVPEGTSDRAVLVVTVLSGGKEQVLRLRLPPPRS